MRMFSLHKLLRSHRKAIPEKKSASTKALNSLENLPESRNVTSSQVVPEEGFVYFGLIHKYGITVIVPAATSSGSSNRI